MDTVETHGSKHLQNDAQKQKNGNADFPLLMTLRLLMTSSKEGLSDGSSAQHCFIRVEMPRKVKREGA